MALVRCITEMGMGVDVHGLDYTLAAKRAVFDAIHHSSLGFARLVGATADDMTVHVLIGVPHPEKVNTDEVAAALPTVMLLCRWWWVVWSDSTRTAATARSLPTPSSPSALTTVNRDKRRAPTSSDWTYIDQTGMACRGDSHDDASGQRRD